MKPTAPVIVRALEPDDIPSLSALAKTTYADTFGHSMTEAELGWQLQHGCSEQYFRDRRSRDAILVAVAGSRIVGYVQVCDVTLPIEPVDDRDAQVNALYVGRAHQGQGVGRQLMDAALALARARSAADIYLDVWPENARALQFYARYGFQPVGECDVIIDGKVVGKDLILRRAGSG